MKENLYAVLKAYLSCWEHPGSRFPDFLQPGKNPTAVVVIPTMSIAAGQDGDWNGPHLWRSPKDKCCQERVSNLAVQKKWMWQIWRLGCLASAARSWQKSRPNQTASRVVVFGAAMGKRTARTCLLKIGRWMAQPPLTCPLLCSSTQNQQNSKRSCWRFQTATF